MAEPLKNLYTPRLILSVGKSLKDIYPPFEVQKFTSEVFADGWQNKELKSRMRHIAIILHNNLPQDYHKAIFILKAVADKFNGFEYMFFPDFVELYGLNNYDESIKALEFFTEFSSSEFAIRPFITKYPQQTMLQMERWAFSKNLHIRRLASEGCRPRLPWATALPEFKKDPTAVIKILEILKNDDSKYVRKSAANNLNDISKDNPKTVINIAKKWLNKNPNTDKLIKHACRSLLKQGNIQVLEMFGYQAPNHIKILNFTIAKQVNIGDKITFSFCLSSVKNYLGNLRIEYAIGFLKNNGKQANKIFKISETNCKTQLKQVVRQHSFKLISTRKYYIGCHTIAIIVNGVKIASDSFVLVSA